MTHSIYASAGTTAPAPTPSPTDPSSTGLGNDLNGSDFMTLLIAQLKNQDPTSPMDPTQFVTQLVQFNSLEQLIQINGKVTPPPAAPTDPSNPNPTNPTSNS